MAAAATINGNTNNTVHVLSDAKHYSPLLCNLCHNLVSLDAVVTIRCSHPFCRSCLETWAAKIYNENGSTTAGAGGHRAARRGSANGSSSKSASSAALSCPCPDCCVDLSVDPSLECMELGKTMLAARPLEEAQPIAHAVLKQVQVSCCSSSGSSSSSNGGGNSMHKCGWRGDYGEYLAHAMSCHGGGGGGGARNGNSKISHIHALIPPTSPSRKPPSPTRNKPSSPTRLSPSRQHQQGLPPAGALNNNNASMARDKRPIFPKMLSLPSIFNKDQNVKYDKAESVASESFTLEQRRSDPHSHNNQSQQQQQFLYSPKSNPKSFKKSQSMRNVNGGTSMLPPVTPPQRSSSMDDDDDDRHKHGASKSLGHPVSPQRWDTNGVGAAQLTIPDKSSSSRGSARSGRSKGDVAPSKVERTTSFQNTFQNNNNNAAAVKESTENKKPRQPDDSNKRSAMTKRTHNHNNNNNNKPTLTHEDSISDLESSQYMDWNTSINSLQGWNNSFSDYNRPEVMETLQEFGESGDLQAAVDDLNNGQQPQQQQKVEKVDEEKIARVLEQAGKLKKQANAKFNKGDFNAARALYTDGINAMKKITRGGRQPDDAECELLSNMHSNRAVTYFREKKFEECIRDCDLALRHDETYEKSWIRKWRALMALGRLEEAFACLQTGADTIAPNDARKIEQELTKAKAEMDLLSTATDLVAQGEYQQVHDLLKSQTRMSDNIGILHVAARADAGLGLVESALDKANKALRFNPSQPDGLALRGYVLFVSGETEKGTHLLQDAHGRDKENKKIKQELQRLHKTHSAFNKGRSCVKRGRYLDAVDHFSTAMREIEPLPKRAPLFGMLRVERAEALMLSGKFKDALEDCQDVINAQKENAMAWTVRAEVLIALGRAEEAQKQLTTIRKTWGADNPTIEEGYRRVDFELRVLKADTELMSFVKELELGNIGGGGAAAAGGGTGGNGVVKVIEADRRPPTGDKNGVSNRKPPAEARRSEKRGERASSRSSRPPSGSSDKRRDEHRRSMNGRAKSSRNMMGGGAEGRHDSRQKKRPNGLERKSMSERGFDKNRRPSSTKRT